MGSYIWDLDNSYSRQLVPKTTRTQNNSYPRQLVSRTSRTQDNTCPKQLVPNTARTVTHNEVVSDRGHVVSKTTRIQRCSLLASANAKPHTLTHAYLFLLLSTLMMMVLHDKNIYSLSRIVDIKFVYKTVHINLTSVNQAWLWLRMPVMNEI